MTKSTQILIDSSAFVAWFYENDAFHQAAASRFEWIEKEQLTPVVTSYIVDETATVLSNRKGQELARGFLDFIQAIPVIFITEELREESVSLFKEQQKRGTSVVDCSNVVVLRQQGISVIFSYDSVFSDIFHLNTVQ